MYFNLQSKETWKIFYKTAGKEECKYNISKGVGYIVSSCEAWPTKTCLQKCNKVFHTFSNKSLFEAGGM